VVGSRDGIVFDVDDRLLRLLGKTREEVIGQPAWTLVAPKDLERVRDRVEPTKGDTRPAIFEAPTPNGPVPVLVSSIASGDGVRVTRIRLARASHHASENHGLALEADTCAHCNHERHFHLEGHCKSRASGVYCDCRSFVETVPEAIPAAINWVQQHRTASDE